MAGGVAGATSRSITAPLDRLKTLFMIQVCLFFQKTNIATKKRKTETRSIWQAVERRLSIVGTLKYMVQEGGVRSLWRGNGVNVLKIAPESALKFFAWEHAKKLLHPSSPNQEPGTVERVAAGSLAGLISQTAIYPMEVLKTRMATAKTGQYVRVFLLVRIY